MLIFSKFLYMIEINFGAVFVAAIAGFLVGFTWYHPNVFGTLWMRLAKVNPGSADAKKMMVQSIVLGFVVTAISAYVMAHFIAVWGAVNFLEAAQFGFWVWMGFQMPILIGSVLWEQKPWNLFFLNGAYWLVSMIVMSGILVWMA